MKYHKITLEELCFKLQKLRLQCTFRSAIFAQPLYGSHPVSSSPFCPSWPASRTEPQKNYLSFSRRLERITKHRGFLGGTRVNFTRWFNGSTLSMHWLAQLSENLVQSVCGRSLIAKQKNFFSSVFSNKFFFLLQVHTLKSANSKGICSIALKFGQ